MKYDSAYATTLAGLCHFSHLKSGFAMAGLHFYKRFIDLQ